MTDTLTFSRNEVNDLKLPGLLMLKTRLNPNNINDKKVSGLIIGKPEVSWRHGFSRYADGLKVMPGQLLKSQPGRCGLGSAGTTGWRPVRDFLNAGVCHE
jgi:hypothetical protein